MATPEIQDGYRGPRGSQAPTQPGTGAGPHIPAGKVVFKSRNARLKVQLTAPNAERMPDGRIVDAVRPLRADFEDGICILDPKMTVDAKKIEMLRAHRSYKGNGGVGFWDYAEELAETKQKRIDDAVKELMSAEPEVRERLRRELEASKDADFELPKKQPEAGKPAVAATPPAKTAA